MDMLDEWLSGLCSWASANGNVRELWLFGSRAARRSRPDSEGTAYKLGGFLDRAPGNGSFQRIMIFHLRPPRVGAPQNF